MARDDSSVETRPREQVPPGTFQAITLDDIAVGIRELVELVQSQIPGGEAPYMPLTVGTDLREVPLTPPWFSAQVINDGTAVLEVQLNHTQRPPREVRGGEDVEFHFNTAVIGRLFLRAQSGTLAVRIQGLY